MILVLFLVRKYTQAILTEEDDNLKDGENPLSRKQLTYTNNYKYYLLESNYLEWKNAPHAGYKCLIWIHFCLKSADFCILLWLKPDDYTGYCENWNLTQQGIEQYRQIILIKPVLGYASFCFSYENASVILLRTVIQLLLWMQHELAVIVSSKNIF